MADSRNNDNEVISYKDSYKESADNQGNKENEVKEEKEDNEVNEENVEFEDNEEEEEEEEEEKKEDSKEISKLKDKKSKKTEEKEKESNPIIHSSAFLDQDDPESKSQDQSNRLIHEEMTNSKLHLPTVPAEAMIEINQRLPNETEVALMDSKLHLPTVPDEAMIEIKQHLPSETEDVLMDSKKHLQNEVLNTQCDIKEFSNLDIHNNQTEPLRTFNSCNLTSQHEMNKRPSFSENKSMKSKENIDSTHAYIKMLTDDIHKKTSIIKSLSSTNALLRQNMIKFSEEIEILYQKKVMKNCASSQKQKNSSLEMDLQIKEQKLRNHIIIIDNLSKENKRLKKKLEALEDYDYKTELDNQIKVKTKENEELIKESKMYKRLLAEHENCNKGQEQLETLINSLKRDVGREKQKFAELKSSYHALEEKCNNLQSKIDNNNSDIQPGSSSVQLRTPKTQPLNKKKEVINCSVSQPMPTLKEIFNSNRMMDVFDEEEKALIEKLLKDKPEKRKTFLKKIHIIETYRTSNDSIQKSELRKKQEEVHEKEEQLMYLNEKCKETESKMKITSFQVNDLKQNNKTYKKKINELQQMIDSLNAKMKEKEKEKQYEAYAAKEFEMLQKLLKDTSSSNDDLNKGVQTEILKIKREQGVSISSSKLSQKSINK